MLVSSSLCSRIPVEARARGAAASLTAAAVLVRFRSFFFLFRVADTESLHAVLLHLKMTEDLVAGKET